MSNTDIAANATLQGLFALFVAVLGVEPQAIIWSLVGSVIGVVLAKPSGRFYAVALFIAATLSCALIGTAAAQSFQWGNTGRNAFSAVMGVCFHPALAALISEVPTIIKAIVDFFAKRFLGRQ